MCASHSGEPRHVEAVADMLARAGCSAGRPAMRHACAGLLRARAARCRRRRPIRRCSTTVRASTAAMLAWCVQCGHAKRRLPRLSTIRCSRRSAARSPASPASPRTRLVAGIDGCSAPNYAVPLASLAHGVRPARERRRRCAITAMAPRMLANAMIAHPGNGVGRAPQRSRADAGRPRRLGDARSARKACRRSGSAARASGIAIKVADGHKRGLYPAIVAVLDAAGTAGRRRSRTRSAPWARRTVRNYRGIETGDVRRPRLCSRPFDRRNYRRSSRS